MGNRSFTGYVADKFYNELFAAIQNYTECNYDESETCRPWFMVKCIGDLNCNLDEFTITNISLFNSKNKQAKPMLDSLVSVWECE